MTLLAAGLVSSARRYRGVSGRELARAANASQPSLVQVERGEKDATAGRLERLLRPLGYQLTVLPTRLGTAAAAAEDVRGFLIADDEPGARRVIWQLASDLSSAGPALRVALCVTPPATTGSGRFDALLAGVVEHSLALDAANSVGRLPRPEWLDEPSRTLSEPWDVEPVPALQPRARELTSASLRAHGVYLDPAELVNA